jgi:excisionase family DNA binding protein
MDEEIFLTVKQLSKLLQVSEQSIRKWAREDSIPHLKVGINGIKDYRFDRKEILDFFKSKEHLEGASETTNIR